MRASRFCRCCHGTHLLSRGTLPDARVFAGTLLPAPLPGGTLFRCLDCGLLFRHPIHAKEDYDQWYRAGRSTTWDEEGRRDQDLVRGALNEFVKGGSVLDVGCGAGNLLAPLAGTFSKFGVEINPEAAAVAGARGVRIVARDLIETSGVAHNFDAAVCCDVIEHVANPLEFMRMVLSKTERGGLVVVSTGDADATSWRLCGSRFWYCYLPEHISFVSPSWFERHTETLGVEIAAVRRFNYGPEFPVAGKMLRLGLMALFRMSPALYYRLLPPAKRANIPVGRGITRDHFLIVLRKLS